MLRKVVGLETHRRNSSVNQRFRIKRCTNACRRRSHLSQYIKTAADDVKRAMAKLENNIPQAPEIVQDTCGTLDGPEKTVQDTIQ